MSGLNQAPSGGPTQFYSDDSELLSLLYYELYYFRWMILFNHHKESLNLVILILHMMKVRLGEVLV